MALPIQEATLDKKFEVIVSYNGVDQVIEVNGEQVVQAVLQHALQAFGIPHNPQNLVLASTESPNVELQGNVKVEDAGIRPGTRLLLRPRSAQSG